MTTINHFYERMVQTMNRLFNSITLTETQKNALFAFGEKDKIGTGANLIIAACMCEGELTKAILMNLADLIESVGITDEEFEQIKRHPIIGSQILKNIKEMPKLSIGARWHHERYDGTGYPDGLAGEEIPEEARIVAVADAYDAMSSKRSYRNIMPQAKIREEILRGSGTQFDPRFAQIMLKMIDEDTHYTMREGGDE